MQQILGTIASTITLHPPGHTGTPTHTHHPHHTHGPGHHPIPPPGHRFPGSDLNLHIFHDVAHKPAHIALWVFFGVFTAGIAGVAYLGSRVQARARVFHALSALTLAITAVTYFMLATGVGVAPTFVQLPYPKPPSQHTQIHGHHGHHGHNGTHPGYPGHGHPGHGHHGHNGTQEVRDSWHLRQTYWLRDLSHTFSAPLLVAQLALLAGLAPASALIAIVSSGFSVFVASQANHFANRTKFHPRAQFVGYAVVSLIFMVVSFWTLFIDGVGAARLRRSKTKGLFYLLTLHTFVAWVIYAIIFTLGTGLNIISVTAEVIALGIVDIAAQLGFVGVLLFLHVHDEEDPTWTFPSWFVENRGAEGGDGRGSYAAVAAE